MTARRAVFVSIASSMLLLGCSQEMPAPGDGARALDGKADGLAPTAVLELAADYGETLHGEIVAGRPFVVRYSLDRVAECRGSTAGSDVWGVTGFYSVDGDEAVSFPVSELRDGVTTGLDAIVVPPAGRDIALWFQATNRWGCVWWDSDYGADYHYVLRAAAPESASLSFPAEGGFEGPESIAAGSEVVVRYALERLPSCRGSSGGYPQWSITGYYSIDGDAPESFEVSRVEGSDRVPVDATLSIPAGRELALWFRASNRWGCVSWDSREGDNYVVPIE